MAKKISSQGGETAATMVGSRKPEIFEPLYSGPVSKMTKAEMRRASKQAKRDARDAFMGGQLRSSRALKERSEALRKHYKE